MKITNISRSKSYEIATPFGLKVWDKIGAEGTLSDNEDPKECYRTLDKLIEETHKESLKEWGELPIQHVQQSEKSMIEEMEACTTYADIQSFRFTIKNADEQAVYERKLSELNT